MSTAAAAGVVCVGVSAVASDALARVTWFRPSVDVAVFILAAVAAAIGFTDAWTERDRRPLPLAAATLTVGCLWLANVPTFASSQTATGLGLLAHTVGPVLWVASWRWARPVFLRRPKLSIVSSAAGSVITAAGLVAIALVALPHLPALADGSGSTLLTRVIAVLAVVPLAASAWLYRRAALAATERAGTVDGIGLDRGDRDRAIAESSPFVAAMVLLCFQGAAAGITHNRYSVADYALIMARAAAFVLITYGQLRRYGGNAVEARRRAEELLLLHASTDAFVRTLDADDVAAELARAVAQAVWSRTGCRVTADIFLDEGKGLRRLGPTGDHGEDLEPFRPLIGSLIRAGSFQSREIARGTWVLFGSPNPRTTLVVELRGLAVARHTVSTSWVTVVENIMGAAALALSRANGLAELRQAEEHHRGVLDAITDAFISIDPSGRIIGWNEGATRLTGWTAERIIGRELVDTLIPAQHQEAARLTVECVVTTGQNAAPIEPFEAVILHADGSPVPIEARVWRVMSGTDLQVCMLGHDISKRKREEAALTRRATHDPLTDLPNRALIMDVLTQSLAEANRSKGMVGAIFVDMDGFKQVNDRFGHDAGDRLLVVAAMRLLRAVRPSDLVGRLGGDEFLILCRGLQQARELSPVVDRLRESMGYPFSVTDASDMHVRASIGFALGQPGSISARELVNAADDAMYADKEKHRSGRSAEDEEGRVRTA